MGYTLMKMNINTFTKHFFLIVCALSVFTPSYTVLAQPFAYVPNELDDTVSVINTVTNSVVATVPVGSGPVGIAVNPAGTHAYVTNRKDSTLSVIETATNTVIATVPVGYGPVGVALNPGGTRVYVANRKDNTVSVINSVDHTLVNSIPVGFGPFGVAMNPAGTLAYVTNTTLVEEERGKPGRTLSVISATTNAAVASISVGLSDPWGIAVNPAVKVSTVGFVELVPVKITPKMKEPKAGPKFPIRILAPE